MAGNKQADSQSAKKRKSPFISYCITTVSCLLIVAVTFAIVMFKTNTIFSVDIGDSTLHIATQSNSVSYVVTTMQIEKEPTLQEIPDSLLAGVAPDSQGNNQNNPGGNGSGNTNYTPGSNITLNMEASAIADKLRTSSSFAAKADAMALAYQHMKPLFGDNAAVGLMANIAAEGNYGVVEHSFSKSGAHGFSLPSGYTDGTIHTVADIRYCLNWDSTDRNSYDTKVKKGSCGIGSVQWSFGRRVTFCNIALSIMKTDADVTAENWSLVEANMFSTELSTGTTEYNNLCKYADSNWSCEDWAEAICDYYERAGGSCPSSSEMSGTGTGCQSRRAIATEIYNLLK